MLWPKWAGGIATVQELGQIGHRIRACRAAQQRRQLLAQDCALDLEHRAFGPRRLSFGGSTHHPQVGCAHRHQVDFHLRHPGCKMRVSVQRPAPGHGMRGDMFERGQCRIRKSHAGNVGALVGQQIFGIGPALVLFADQVFDRHTHVVEENLVHLCLAIDQYYGSHGDAGRFHIDQQEGNARLFLHIGTGAHKTEDPVCVLTQRRPGLLAVDHIMIAIWHRGGFQSGKV